MILIGQYDSPFVRRVGVAMTLYGLPYEHRPWSTFGDAEKIRPYSPLLRVPTLVLDDGETLIDSHMIIDHIDSLIEPERRMYPVGEPARRRALKIAALAAGISDKAVSLFYELKLHDQSSKLWVDRCRSQIFGALSLLDADRAGRTGDYWFGDAIGHADIVVATMLRHLTEAHPGLVSLDALPALKAHWQRLESLPVFEKIRQPFIAPA
ncbi:glutathione S-transferase family protein [Mesorhizobium sp. LHD-90]|uniref:glutathione S-transferase family protein n=1 Tax=Mesorhizobium sp. LHD-90 TaxID=3071414 RepID=UPI0027E05555|nr:glutathione S-transferase family protein [Mesorhizobium sp. LHD-90]MDQ6437238.1 glutathione S-transferase family protein [Mesorhizobium sp. LHD-90]